MMKKILSLLRGNVRLHIRCAYPERVLNICTAHGIDFRALRWLGADELAFELSRRDERVLRRALGKLDAEIRVESREGVPFALGRVRRRHVLLAGLCACALLLCVNACFIWDFQVSGNTAVPSERILRVLAKNGVGRGTFAFSFDQRTLRNRALLELPELCWLTVNVRGCRAYVIVRERVPVPEIVNESAPTNVVADKAALVTSVRVFDGEARVLKGTTVLPGQLLISGVVETGGTEAPSVGTRFLAGKGEVWGRTWYELSVRVPLTAAAKRHTGEEISRYALLWGEKRVKFYGKGAGQTGVDCDKIVERTQWTLPGGFVLPVTVEKETLRPYETFPAARSRSEAEAAGEAVLTAYLLSLLGGTGSVTSSRCASAAQGDWLLVTLSAECLEQIGREVPILTES